MAGKKEIIPKLIEPKISKVLATLINNPKAFYLKELSGKAGVPIASTYRILQKLDKLNLVQVIKISKFKLYTFSSSEEANFLSSLFIEKQNALEIFVSRAKQSANIESIILQGEEEEDKANLIIIGEKIDSIVVDKLAHDVLSETGFQISFVPLDDAQFKKMTSMGLYSGKKKILYSRNS